MDTNYWVTFLYLAIIFVFALIAYTVILAKVRSLPLFVRNQVSYHVTYDNHGRSLQHGVAYPGSDVATRFGFGIREEYRNTVDFHRIFENIRGLSLPEQRELEKTVNDLGYQSMFELIEESGVLRIRAAYLPGEGTKEIYYYGSDNQICRIDDRGCEFDAIARIDDACETAAVVLCIPETQIRISLIHHL